MKTPLLLAAILFGSAAFSNLLAQGFLRWGNLFTGVTRAPVFGPEPGDPTRVLRGNPPGAGVPVIGMPAGTTIYSGAPLAGTGYTMGLFLGLDNAAAAANQTANATATFRTGAAAGFMNLMDYVDPTWPPEPASAQFRAWSNMGGTVTSWAQVMARVMAGDTQIQAGSSDPFFIGLIGPSFTTPDTTGIRSFNLTQVPEPSLIALGAVGLGAALIRRRN